MATIAQTDTDSFAMAESTPGVPTYGIFSGLEGFHFYDTGYLNYSPIYPFTVKLISTRKYVNVSVSNG